MIFDKNKVFYLLFLLLAISLGTRVYFCKDRYFIRYDPVYWQNKYLRSQWVIPGSKEGIGDDGLYGYAGWEYIHGRDPSTLNAEMPPVGKYLIGLTILVFKNKNVFGLITSLSALACLYLFSLKVFNDKNLALMTVLFFSFEPLFREQFRSSGLDSLYLSFLLATLFFLMKKDFILGGLFAGLFVNTKSFLSSSFLIFLMTAVIMLFNQQSINKKIKEGLKFLFFFIVATILSYIVFFIDGHNLIDFLKLQKYVFNFYKTGAKGKFGDSLSMLILGNWHTWWNGVIKVKFFTFFWPLTTILSFLSLFRIKKELVLVVAWWLIYFLFLLFIPVWPRYFLLLLPFSYILSIDFLRDLLAGK